MIRTGCIVLLAFLLGACGPIIIDKPDHNFETSEQFLAQAAALRMGVESFRIAGTIDHVAEQRIRGDVYIFSELPDRLRIDVLSPFGTTMSVLTADDGAFGISDHQNGKYYAGEASPCNVQRFVGLPMPLEELVRVLVGWTPLIKGEAVLDWDKRGFWLVTITQDTWVQTLRFDPDVKALQLRHSQLSVDGKKVHDVKYNLWRQVGNRRVPGEIHITMPSDDAELFVRYADDGVEFDVTFPDDAFVQTVPNGVAVEKLICGSTK